MTSSPNTPLTGGAILGNGLEAATYKATAVATVQEYLNSNDMQEVCSTLEELQQPQLAHIFVKQVSKGWLLLGGHAALSCYLVLRKILSCPALSSYLVLRKIMSACTPWTKYCMALSCKDH